MGNWAFKYSAVINILCDVIAEVVDGNMKTCPLTSDELVEEMGSAYRSINMLNISPTLSHF